MTSDFDPARDARRQGLTYYVGIDHLGLETNQPAWAIWRRCNIGKSTEFAERSYVLEQLGTRQKPVWVRRGFTSAGWWKTEAAFDTRAAALTDLTALCERLNQPLEG